MRGIGGAESVQFGELEAATGHEQTLDAYLGLVRAAAGSVGAFDRVGTCLITCADELQVELRERYEADVAKNDYVGHRGRLELGAYF